MARDPRNWQIVGLTDDNRVIKQVNGGEPYETEERPSEYWGIGYLPRKEIAILRRGLNVSTKTGRVRDRAVPRGA